MVPIVANNSSLDLWRHQIVISMHLANTRMLVVQLMPIVVTPTAMVSTQLKEVCMQWNGNPQLSASGSSRVVKFQVMSTAHQILLAGECQLHHFRATPAILMANSAISKLCLILLFVETGRAVYSRQTHHALANLEVVKTMFATIQELLPMHTGLSTA